MVTMVIVNQELNSSKAEGEWRKYSLRTAYGWGDDDKELKA